jgi:antitoxin (DNA-binding transcriptional repressor) of toxin-antitoxin stability system
MAVLHMTEDEIAKDFAAVMEKVRQGSEVIVEHNHQPVAVLRPADPPRRTASEVLALMPKDSTAVMDADFARDVLEGIESRAEPLDSSKWD